MDSWISVTVGLGIITFIVALLRCFFNFFISVAVAPVRDLTSSDKYELLSNFAISCSQTTVHSSSPPVAGADSQTCASTTSADTWWSCSPWVQTRPSSTPSATSSRCRRSWRNSTDVAAKCSSREDETQVTPPRILTTCLTEETNWRWVCEIHHAALVSLQMFDCSFVTKDDKEASFITYLIVICSRSKNYASIQTWKRDIIGLFA